MSRLFLYHQNMKKANPIEIDSALYRKFVNALPPTTRLAWDVAICTGLRVSDVLQLRPDMLSRGRTAIVERKTGKWRSIPMPDSLYDRLIDHAALHNSDWCFPAATDTDKPMSRDVIGAQLRRVNRLVAPQYTLSMHSARKIYAINLYRRTGDYNAVQRDLGHEHLETTLIYIHGAPMAR